MRAIASAAAVASVAALTVLLPQTANATTAPVVVPGYEFSLLGQHSLPGGTRYRGTEVGGITGADYDASTGEFRLLAGDPRSPRFYTGKLNGHCAPKLTAVTSLRQAENTDPQALRHDSATGTLLWTDGGGAQDPSVREADKRGGFVTRLPTPATLAGASGLTALAPSADGTGVLAALSRPLAADGPAVRFTQYERASATARAQYAYLPETGAEVTELLAVADTRYLVLEQVEAGSAKLFEVDFALGATNIARRPALDGTTYSPVVKREVLAVSALGLRKVDDLQAMTWGPELGDGARTLVLVSDNGLDDWRRTQFIAVKVELG
ncbi:MULTISPECIES: esterase-like activity of phytase family protein [Actinosynnema]|uniref:esterase-like activity of phytase family protein n=1 Tax=Actinosynnema TaxID=40566 RepID=UPI0020A4BFA8|nr:esterase-like activity of phytase family protein [Actinosynnema pretiosum]MCP2092315.1 3-phytase [Actinosynnema pretiosum]